MKAQGHNTGMKNMSLTTRKPITDVQDKLDAFEYINNQIHDTIQPIGHVTTDPKTKTYHTSVNGEVMELTEGARNQLLGIGNFGIRSFKDAERVTIKGDINAGVYMLDAVQKYADKDRYKFRDYKGEKVISTVNPKYPSIDGIALFKEVFEQLGRLGLTPKVYNMEFDPISGRQSMELVIEQWDKDTKKELGQSMGVGFKITNNINGHGHFMIQIYAVQLVCTNGMIAPVSVGGLKILHRTEGDMLKKFRSWISDKLNRYVRLYNFGRQFYSMLAEAVIITAEAHSDLISSALKRARDFELSVTPEKYFEAIAKKESIITQADIERMITIRMTDSTMTLDKDNQRENNLLNVVQAITRYSNEVVSSEKRDNLQEYAYTLATTPLIVNP